MSKTKLKIEIKSQAKPLTTATQQELKALKKQINDCHDDIESMKSKHKTAGNEIISEAIIEGDRLTKVKKLVPYGSFGKWITDNCKKISVRTAQRYMTLATHAAQLLKTDIGLRKAYALVGIIKEDSSDDVNATSSPIQLQDDQTIKPKPVVTSLAVTAANKARALSAARPVIQKEETLSRAKYLASELLAELNSKIINKSILKSDARQIVQPLIELLKD